MSEVLNIQNISKKYQAKNGEIVAIRDLSFSVYGGDYLSIVGPSGCGKSTLLSIIAGLTKASGGRIALYNENLTGISPYIGYMLQRDNLLPWRSIFKNIILGLEIRAMVSNETLKYASDLIKTYGLWDFKDKYPSQLSGGMRQRAALIRTLCIKPKILLLDEAFSALDYQTRLRVTDDVWQILKNENMTTIMVTHDIPEAVSMSNRVLIMTERPASVKKIIELDFGADMTPLERRDDPRFRIYFNRIWKELDKNV